MGRNIFDFGWEFAELFEFFNLPGVWYPGESISLEYDSPVSQSPREMIPRRVNLPGVSLPSESVFFKLKFELLREILTKIYYIEIEPIGHWLWQIRIRKKWR